MKTTIRDMSWTEFDEYVKSSPLVIIPTGAVEVYGPHMPLGSDIIVVEEVAKRLSEATGALIAPSMSVGESRVLAKFPGTLTVDEAHFRGYLEDVCESLRSWGITKFLFITGHAGNVPMVSSICKAYKLSHPEIKTAQIDWWRFVGANSGDALEHQGYMAHGHASECATSIMLHIRPELVNMDAAVKFEIPEDQANQFPDILQYFTIDEKTKTGTVGDGTIATAEKGEKIIANCIKRLEAFVSDYY
ncbi:creatininase family protein [Fusibacter paucivorans]|uniref:Creatininase family protein n=1 Tax=Fusibacter paucivorans TaxID=76009 RepID=A0ABS5PMC1_9FIRM|nr:creatininase family protein [Fusibacter paucivorans]MBS7526330.1 creatininase family protein [Fusibacter paucivorans]